MILLESIIGSNMHGTQTKNSDEDKRSVCISPLADLVDPFVTLGTTHKVDGKDDHVVYELQHFLRLLTKGSPSVIDVVYSPKLRMFGPLAEELVRYRTRFIDKAAAVEALKGYCKGMQKNATNGIRSYKSLRSAALTACVVDACLKDTLYDPLTYPVVSSIIKYGTENGDGCVQWLTKELDDIVTEVTQQKYQNLYDKKYIRGFCYRAYTGGTK